MGNHREMRKPGLRGRAWAPALALMTVAVLSACGGGGSGDGAAKSPATVQGTAASGAFMAGATVTVRDADGRLVGTSIADANGKYSFDVSDFRAPFVVVATGNAGGGTVSYVSVLASKPASGATTTVNVSPLTNALAALLVGGNPLDLINAATLNSKVTSAQVQQAVAALRAVLANIAADAGLDAGAFDPISTPLSTQGQGADAVIDRVLVTLTSTGVKVASTGAVMSGGTVPERTLTPGSLANPPAALPAPAARTNAATFEAIRASLQACFAVAPSARASVSALLGACAPAFASNYLNSSYSARDDFDALLTSADMTGAKFQAPIVLFNSKNGSNEDDAFVRFPYVRADGTTSQFSRRVTNRAATGWTLTGNERPYEAAVTRRISKVVEQNPGGGIVSRYETALRVLLNPQRAAGANVQLVRVTGPGLSAAGVVLARSRVCGTFANMVVQNLNGSLTYAANDPFSPNATIGDSGQSSSTVVLAARPLNTADTMTWAALASGGNTYAATPLTDDGIDAVPTFASYTFEVWNRNADQSYKTSLSATPDDTFTLTSSGAIMTPSVIARETWNAIDPASLGFLTLNGKIDAQLDTTVSWTQNAEPVDRALAFGRKNVAPNPSPLDRTLIQTNVPSYKARSVVVTTLGQGSSAGNGTGINPAGNCATIGFPTYMAAGDQRTVEVRSTTADDTQKFVRVIGTYR
ncbi:Ig-like domain-containing protein [Cupriavidus sp. RAF12]|uniref:Ig-like domain-containing protein n=1 Tax=Cupriavidus sp. RAF12 TaxID=3233050 RepID=UPI003F90EA84